MSGSWERVRRARAACTLHQPTRYAARPPAPACLWAHGRRRMYGHFGCFAATSATSFCSRMAAAPPLRVPIGMPQRRLTVPWRGPRRRGRCRATWTERHGAALGLRAVLQHHGATAGMCGPDAIDSDSNRRRHRTYMSDITVRLVCVLALDRFADFGNDQVRRMSVKPRSPPPSPMRTRSFGCAAHPGRHCRFFFPRVGVAHRDGTRRPRQFARRWRLPWARRCKVLLSTLCTRPTAHSPAWSGMRAGRFGKAGSSASSSSVEHGWMDPFPSLHRQSPSLRRGTLSDDAARQPAQRQAVRPRTDGSSAMAGPSGGL